jgi:hypothetical protein
MKLATVKKYFDEADLTNVDHFNFYYVTFPAIPDYTSPSAKIPVVAGQTKYEVDLPGEFNLPVGVYNIGISAADASGNETDIDVIEVPLAVPTAPKWER